MREIPVGEVAGTVRRSCLAANHELRGDEDIAAFPVAINLDCRSHRVRRVTL